MARIHSPPILEPPDCPARPTVRTLTRTRPSPTEQVGKAQLEPMEHAGRERLAGFEDLRLSVPAGLETMHLYTVSVWIHDPILGHARASVERTLAHAIGARVRDHLDQERRRPEHELLFDDLYSIDRNDDDIGLDDVMLGQAHVER